MDKYSKIKRNCWLWKFSVRFFSILSGKGTNKWLIENFNLLAPWRSCHASFHSTTMQVASDLKHYVIELWFPTLQDLQNFKHKLSTKLRRFHSWQRTVNCSFSFVLGDIFWYQICARNNLLNILTELLLMLRTYVSVVMTTVALPETALITKATRMKFTISTTRAYVQMKRYQYITMWMDLYMK